MSDVGVRELKQHLSDYLRRAEQGEVIRVTDRGKPKAILGPLPGYGRIESGIAEGWVTAGTGESLGPVKRAPGIRSVRGVLAEDRDE